MIYQVEMDYLAKEARARLGEDACSPLDVFALVLQIPKLTLARVDLGKHIAGMTLKSNATNVIAINSTFPLGRQRFSLAHELYHLWYDNDKNSISIAEYNSKSEVEKKANAFAAYFLVPFSALKTKADEINLKSQVTVENVIKLEQFFGISHSAMVWRLFNDNYINANQRKQLEEIQVTQTAKLLGYDTLLYQPLLLQQQRTYGYYIEQTQKLLAKGIISQGKYEELLLDAFRDDIVFGDEGQFADE